MKANIIISSRKRGVFVGCTVDLETFANGIALPVQHYVFQNLKGLVGEQYEE